VDSFYAKKIDSSDFIYIVIMKPNLKLNAFSIVNWNIWEMIQTQIFFFKVFSKFHMQFYNVYIYSVVKLLSSLEQQFEFKLNCCPNVNNLI
jgi:hypothetical protein